MARAPQAIELEPGRPCVTVLAVNAIGAGLDLAAQTHLTRLHGTPEDRTLADLLGAPDLDLSRTEVFAVRDVAALGLAGYLQQAYDLAPADLQADAPKLAALEGHVVVLGPEALGRGPRRLPLPPGLSLIARYPTAQPDTRALPPLATKAAKGTLAAPQGPSQLGAARPRWLYWAWALVAVGLVALMLLAG